MENTTQVPNKATLEEMKLINPMIESDGSTYRVASALTALASLISGEQSMEPDEATNHGLSIVLETCAAALIQMQRAKS
ncbi:MAG: hypothetical protein KAX99_04345 [Azonexus sp.]|jgi:hypothetical protein|nr:hypothetical protein [Azonexus sp.]